MGEAVNGGMSHFFITRIGEVREPFFDGAVGCQDKAFLLIAVFSDEVEEELDGIGITWRIAELIENDEIEFSEAFEEASVFGGSGIPEALDKVGKTIKGDFFEVFARLDAEGNCEVSFASTWLAVQEQIVTVVDELTLGEIGHGN